jgi:endonuclease/exonuclease/phosphatase family metal-dependent hydrolase
MRLRAAIVGSVRVMTWNLLTDAVPAAPPWPVRCPRVAERVTTVRPIVLGTQEASAAMLDVLVGALPDAYRWVGEGRRGRLTDETCGVVYDSSALTVLDVRHRWLSATPEVPGSRADDAHLPRMLTAVRFFEAATTTAFTVVNTHLDHVGARSRVLGAELVAEYAKDGPAVVMGDFNDAALASPAYDTLARAGLRDALSPRDQPRQRLRTFVDLDQALSGEGEQIDWLFVTPDVRVQGSWVDAGPPTEPMASDHRAIVAEVHLP